MTRPPGDCPAWVVSADGVGQRLDRWLADPSRLGSRARATDAITKGRVFLNDVEVGIGAAGRRLAGGERVVVWMDRPGSASRRPARRSDDLTVVYEDGHLIVVDKPAGLLTVPLPSEPGVDSVADRIELHWRSHGRRKPAVVHRIDRDTSGLVVFARTGVAHESLKAQFLARSASRLYLAVMRGCPEPAEGTWRDSIRWDDRSLRQWPSTPRAPGAVACVCRYRLVERFATTSLVEVSLETGKQHQIRVQAWMHGHALIGERLYADDDDGVEVPAFSRQALHASRLGLVHPIDGRPLAFEAPLPAEMRKLLTRLRTGR